MSGHGWDWQASFVLVDGRIADGYVLRARSGCRGRQGPSVMKRRPSSGTPPRERRKPILERRLRDEYARDRRANAVGLQLSL